MTTGMLSMMSVLKMMAEERNKLASVNMETCPVGRILLDIFTANVGSKAKGFQIQVKEVRGGGNFCKLSLPVFQHQEEVMNLKAKSRQ